ncbi:MAG: UbiD family decarboxylase [Chloroflexi bacterium]|nr:UbiD family decarboxylase [Chloroflexota bacterium]
MPFKDVRQFIAALEQHGELVRIREEVDWNLEAGAILRRSHEERLPAPFFEKVKDYPASYKLCGGILANHRRLAIAMDLHPDTPPRKLQEEYLKRTKNPIKPVVVSDGPCKENIQVGDQVDLFQFPVPLIHGGDGGRYIATFHLNISKDPETDWVNWGMYRGMLHDKRRVGVTGDPATNFGGMLVRYEGLNKPMPTAIAIGVEPISFFCSASPIPHGVSEVDVAGGIRGEPIELVRCETVDVLVPATSEIVIEGEMWPHDRLEDGPFGEFTGYQTAGKLPRPVMRVTAVTYRNNPIFTFSNEGMPLADSHSMISISKGAECLEALRKAGIPVTGVCVPPEDAIMLIVVAVKAAYAGIASDVAHVIWSVRASRSASYLIVVDHDVDPFNPTQVMHALVSKCHPSKGIIKIEPVPTISYIPWANEHERKYRIGAKTYFDCTWPRDWEPSEVPVRASFADIYPSEVQEAALAKWRQYGY